MSVNHDTIQICARDRQSDAFVGADGDQNRFIALVEQIVQVFHALVEAQVDAQVDDVLHFALDDLRR